MECLRDLPLPLLELQVLGPRPLLLPSVTVTYDFPPLPLFKVSFDACIYALHPDCHGKYLLIWSSIFNLFTDLYDMSYIILDFDCFGN